MKLFRKLTSIALALALAAAGLTGCGGGAGPAPAGGGSQPALGRIPYNLIGSTHLTAHQSLHLVPLLTQRRQLIANLPNFSGDLPANALEWHVCAEGETLDLGRPGEHHYAGAGQHTIACAGVPLVVEPVQFKRLMVGEHFNQRMCRLPLAQ